MTTFDPVENSDVSFSDEQQNDSSLRKCFLNATKAKSTELKMGHGSFIRKIAFFVDSLLHLTGLLNS